MMERIKKGTHVEEEEKKEMESGSDSYTKAIKEIDDYLLDET